MFTDNNFWRENKNKEMQFAAQELNFYKNIKRPEAKFLGDPLGFGNEIVPGKKLSESSWQEPLETGFHKSEDCNDWHADYRTTLGHIRLKPEEGDFLAHKKGLNMQRPPGMFNDGGAGGGLPPPPHPGFL